MLSGVVGGVLFDVDDTLVDLRSAAVDGFLAMVQDNFSVVDHALRLQIAGDFADDGAHAFERYMAGELTFLEQRTLRIQRAYGLASVSRQMPWR